MTHLLRKLQDRLGLQVIPAIFFSAAVLAVLFVAIAIPFNEEVAAFFQATTGWTTHNLGWFYVLSVTGLLIFLIWVSLSRYGSIRLGADDERPEYGTGTWFCMLFAAGIGTILMFWGVAEPMHHFSEPPLDRVAGGSREAAELAMTVSFYHFGLHTWTIFTLPALAIGYFSYRHGLPMRISSVFYPLFGPRVFGPIGWMIDVIALLGTLFGVAVSVGLGTLQLNSGLNHLIGLPVAAWSQVVIVAIITVVATVSVALGLDHGIRRLSQFNILLAVALMLFIWVAGPTLFITKGAVENTGLYLSNLSWLAFWTENFQGTDWQSSWTVFYWAWTISWAPYVGIFIARISRGRTIRQFVGGALGAPTLFTIVWFSVFGLAAIDQEMGQAAGLADQVREDVSVALFAFIAEFPLAPLLSGAAVFIILIFLTTSADSAALVTDLLSRRDDQPSLVRQRVFWTLALGTLAGTLMLGGGLPALQNLITTLGLPFCALLVFMAVALIRALHADYLGYSLRQVAAGDAPPLDPMGDRPDAQHTPEEAPFERDRDEFR